MHSKQVVKWGALVLLLVSMSVAAIPGTADEPQAEPSAITCGDVANCTLPSPAVEVINHGAGAAIRGRSTSARIGVLGIGQPGVRGKSGNGIGVEGSSDGAAGVYGTSTAYSGEGVHGHGTGYLTEGLLGTSQQNVGVYGISSGTAGNNIGVWGETAGTWGFYSNDSMWVNGCTGCTLSFVGRNADGGALQIGDVVSVSGVEPPLEGQSTPILKVRKAATGEVVLGIVLARAEIDTAQARSSSVESKERFPVELASRAEGSVAPGDYLFIVVQGLVQVRADAAAGIQAGDRLMAGSQGLAVLADPDAPTIGQALDAVDPATGLVWVLVALQ